MHRMVVASLLYTNSSHLTAYMGEMTHFLFSGFISIILWMFYIRLWICHLFQPISYSWWWYAKYSWLPPLLKEVWLNKISSTGTHNIHHLGGGWKTTLVGAPARGGPLSRLGCWATWPARVMAERFLLCSVKVGCTEASRLLLAFSQSFPSSRLGTELQVHQHLK